MVGWRTTNVAVGVAGRNLSWISPSQTKVDNSGVEQRLEQIEVHLKKIDQHLDQIDQRLTEKGDDSLLEVEDLVNQFRQLTDKNKARFLKSINDKNVW